MLLSPASLAIHRSGYFTITEERGWWIKGRRDPDLCFELSFEDNVAIRQAKATHLFPHPRIFATYIGIWTRKRTVAEFQLGTWVKRPVDPEDNLVLSKLLVPLVDVNPLAVAIPSQPVYIRHSGASSASSTTRYL